MKYGDDPQELFDSDPALTDPEDTAPAVVGQPRQIRGYTVPEGALRVRVVDSFGKLKWRGLDDVKPKDTLDLNGSGEAVYMMRPNGRPPNPPPTPYANATRDIVTPDPEDRLAIKAAHMRSDAITQVAEITPESPDVLNQVMLGIAEEASSLKFERLEAERSGESSSTLSMRRVQALKAIGDTWIKRKEQIQSRAIDIDSEAFSSLLQYISVTFATAMQEAGVRQEMSESVFANFAKKLDDPSWKAEAKVRMKE